MSHALAIAGRELAEKRFTFVAAAAFALLAAIMPLMPGVRGGGADAVVLAAMILATAFALGLATILGATIVGRDIAAGRMSFYFARPVGGAAIWFGKLAASVVLVVVSFLIAIAPAFIAGPMVQRALWKESVWQLAAEVAVAALVLFFGAHAIGTMLRSRSAILAADFAAAVLVAMLGWTIARTLIVGQAMTAVAVLGAFYGVALLVAAIGAGAWQLVDGRTDRRRSHRAFSTFFWSALGVALVLAAAFLAWILSAGVDDLRGRMAVLQAPRGDAAIITGDAPHRFDYRPMFLSGMRINGTVWARFSADGRRALLLQTTTPMSQVTELVVRDAANGWRATPTRIVLPHWVGRLTTTDDLARLAIGDFRTVTIYDVASSRSLGSFRLDMLPHAMFFVTPDVLRVYAADGHSIESLEYDVAARALHKLGVAEVRGRPLVLRVSPDGTRAVVGEWLRDARTLQPIAPAAPSAHFLQDGRLVDIDRENAAARAHGLRPVPSFDPFWSADPRPAPRNPNGIYQNAEGALVRWSPR
jgi:hypothetical protein